MYNKPPWLPRQEIQRLTSSVVNPKNKPQHINTFINKEVINQGQLRLLFQCLKWKYIKYFRCVLGSESIPSFIGLLSQFGTNSENVSWYIILSSFIYVLPCVQQVIYTVCEAAHYLQTIIYKRFFVPELPDNVPEIVSLRATEILLIFWSIKWKSQ